MRWLLEALMSTGDTYSAFLEKLGTCWKVAADPSSKDEDKEQKVD